MTFGEHITPTAERVLEPDPHPHEHQTLLSDADMTQATEAAHQQATDEGSADLGGDGPRQARSA